MHQIGTQNSLLFVTNKTLELHCNGLISFVVLIDLEIMDMKINCQTGEIFHIPFFSSHL